MVRASRPQELRGRDVRATLFTRSTNGPSRFAHTSAVLRSIVGYSEILSDNSKNIRSFLRSGLSSDLLEILVSKTRKRRLVLQRSQRKNKEFLYSSAFSAPLRLCVKSSSGSLLPIARFLHGYDPVLQQRKQVLNNFLPNDRL